MSAPTLTRPAADPTPPPPSRSGPTAPPRAPTGSAAAAFGARSAAGRTFRTWVGLALGLTPLFMLISDARWYVVGIGATIVTVAPAWALRLRRPDAPARVWHLLPGLVLLPFYLTAICVPQGALAGIVPTKVTWTQLSLLHDELVDTIARSTAPIDSTPGVRLALAALLGVGMVMVDVLCTVLEAPAMVGLVLLPVFVLSGGTVRQPVSVWWFVLAAVGYLLILTTTGPESKPWGRKIGTRPPGAPPSLVSGRTIGTLAVLTAIILPLVSGGTGANLIADALHTGPGDGDGSGSGTGGVTQFASLKGSLTRGDPISLMTVHVPPNARVEPFYLRQTVLDVFTGDGWAPTTVRGVSDVESSGLSQQPSRPGISTFNFKADVNVSGLDGRAVTFADTVGVGGLPDGSQWDSTHGTFSNSTVRKGTRYSVAVQQPDPTQDELAGATPVTAADGLNDIYRSVPNGLNPLVTNTTKTLVGDQTDPYAIAKAISSYFTDPVNQFQYDLKVPEGDSDDDLVNFLQQKRGFCQQYAATMAVMLRVANVPSRVVVGYTHVPANNDGNFTVTTRDAHAWVEAYIGGIGWLSFDPTPLVNSDAARSVPLPYLHPVTGPTSGSSTGTGVPTSTSSGPGGRLLDPDFNPQGVDAQNTATVVAPDHTGRWVGLWVAVGIVVVLLLTPATMRTRRRRAAHRTTGPAAPEARFDELRDTCVDLGLDWSTARSPRAVAAWLVSHGVPDGMARPLVTAVEQSRYGRTPPTADPRALDAALTRTTAALRRHVRGMDRMRARWWPRSVVLDIRQRTRRRVDTLRESFASWSNRPSTSSRTYGGLRRGRR